MFTDIEAAPDRMKNHRRYPGWGSRYLDHPLVQKGHFLWLVGSIQGSTTKKEGPTFSANPLIFLVAGRGFEPLTFGL